MAVIVSLMSVLQPKCVAMSPITAVRKPMHEIEATKVGQPPNLSSNAVRKHKGKTQEKTREG